MKGRLKTAVFLIALFVVTLAVKITGLYPDGAFSYVLAACFIMAAIEMLCAGAARKHQTVFRVLSNFNPQPEDRGYLDPDPPENIFPAGEVGFLIAATMALIGGPFDDLFDPLITFPMTDAVVMYILILSAGTDAIAYLAGSFATKLGVSHRVRILANISPKKTYEGYLAGLIGGLAISWIFICVLPEHFELFAGATDTLYCKIFAIIACPMIFAGDLLGSTSKRVLQIKDSNHFTHDLFFVRWLEKPMKGHGGYLDRFDSTCLCVCTYMLIKMMLVV